MSEVDFRNDLRDALKGYAITRRIEDMTAAGLPDIVYCLYGGHVGWIEAKYLRDWPIRVNTPVTIKSLTVDQTLFLETWQRYGGTAFLALGVGTGLARWWGLLSPLTARRVRERALNQGELRSAALAAGYGRPDPADLAKALKTGLSGAS